MQAIWKPLPYGQLKVTQVLPDNYHEDMHDNELPYKAKQEAHRKAMLPTQVTECHHRSYVTINRIQ